MNALRAWHQIVESRDPGAIPALLADDVVFHSPVVHTPQRGKPVVTMYLTAALHVFAPETFRYVREIVGERDAALEFHLVLDGITIEGVDLIRWNDAGQIVDFKVMLRPMKALQLIQQKMAAMMPPKP